MRRGGVHALIGLAVAWLAGIACAAHLALNPIQWTLLAAGSGAGALVSRRQPGLRLAFVAALLFTLGALRYLAAQPRLTPNNLVYYAGMQPPVTLTGIISTFPEPGSDRTLLHLRVQSVQFEGDLSPRAVRGLAVVLADRWTPWSYGDRILAYGSLRSPADPDPSQYESYLARQGVQGWMPEASVHRLASRQGALPLQWLDDLRQAGLASVQRLFPEPEASLFAGILLGVESGIPDDVMRAFNRTSTSHVIAISGFNIAILSALFVLSFRRLLGAKRGAWVAVLAIGAYTLLVGASPSVVRAAWMAGLAMLARWLGRTAEALLTLMASAMLMTLIHPAVLFDVGFQLSFAATLGLILYAAPLQARAVAWLSQWLSPNWVDKFASPLAAMVLITLAAQVTTLPLTTYYFQRLSWVSLLANPVILPLQPPLMIVGGLAMALGMISPPIAQPVAWAAWPFAALTIRAVEFFAAWPAGSMTLGRTSPWVVLAFYVLLLGGTALGRRQWMARVSGFSSQVTRSFGPAVLGLCAILVWKAAVDRPDGRLSLTVLESEGGQGILITGPAGRNLMVGGGSDPPKLAAAVGRRLPLLRRSLDWLVLASGEADSLTGWAGLSGQIGVHQVLICGTTASRSLTTLRTDLASDGVPLHQAEAGQLFDLGAGATLTVAAVSDHGCLLLLDHGKAHIVLAPGADPDLIRLQVEKASPRRVTAYIAAAGGHPAANPGEWLELLAPRLVITGGDPGSAAENDALRALPESFGTHLLDTNTHGWIQLETDGERLWIWVQRAPAPGGGSSPLRESPTARSPDG